MTLRGYLKRTTDDSNDADSMFRSFEPILGKILSDCLMDLGEDFRYTKTPEFRCSCGVERVWRTLKLLPIEDIQSIVDGPTDPEICCEFCKSKYVVTRDEILEKILNFKE